MTKLILTGVSLMVFSAAIAQNQATLRQVGTQLNSTQNQVGSHLMSTVIQGTGTNTAINTHNTALTDQSGNNSTATIEQRFFSTANTAILIQKGDNNNGAIEQNVASGGMGVGNTAELFQAGNNNLSTIIQQNNVSFGNQAYLNQYGNNNNETRITQSTLSFRNKATINMGGDGPMGMYPNGWTPVNGGTAIIEQMANSHDNIARIGQSGDGHIGRIYQNNNTANSEAYIDQYASGQANNALIRQTNQSSGTARITQNQNSFGGGNGANLAEVYQGSNAFSLSGGNYTLITQENANNVSRNQQLGTNNVAIISQTGNGNIVEGLGGDSIARQIGSANQLHVTQSSLGGPGNVAHVSQLGTGNVAIISQVSQVSN